MYVSRGSVRQNRTFLTHEFRGIIMSDYEGNERGFGIRYSPLVQPHIVLDKEKVFIGQVRRPQGSGQVEIL